MEPLSDEELTGLHDVLAAARANQARAIAAASAEALQQMPAPLRAGVGKLLGR